MTSVTATVLLLVGAYWSARLGLADHLALNNTVAGIQTAVGLAPLNSRYLLRWADLREATGEPADDLIERALEVSPRDATLWIRAGLRAEVRGDYERAESSLLNAARLSRQYDPRWTLANFYFRRGNKLEFWKWTRSAAEWAYGDRTPLYRLMWELTDDAGSILRHGIPQHVTPLTSYLEFLLRTDRLAAAEYPAKRLVEFGEQKTSGTLLWYINRTLEAKNPAPGMEVWNAMCTRHLLPFEPLNVEQRRLLTNGNFRCKPLESGFDWRLPQITGVASVLSPSPPSLRFSFSGRQPEHCQVLMQSAPVAPGLEHELQFEYLTEQVKPESGVRWRIFDAVSGAELPTRSADLASNRWSQGVAAFTTPAGTQWVRLELWYERTPGTTRIEGSISIRRISLAARAEVEHLPGGGRP